MHHVNVPTRSIADDFRGNGGRRILNEEAVKAAIVKLLQQRGLGERLEVGLGRGGELHAGLLGWWQLGRYP